MELLKKKSGTGYNYYNILRLIPDENYYLTLGNNKFVELLLGQGVIEKIFLLPEEKI